MNMFSKKFWTTMAVSFASLSTVLIVGSNVAKDYAPAINFTLGINNYEIIDNGEDDKKISWNVDYKTKEEIYNYGKDVSERVEAEGLVLLRNENNALPIQKNSKVSLFGTGSININCSVQGMRGATDKNDLPTLKEAFKNVNVEVNPTLWSFYEEGAGSQYHGVKSLDPATNIQSYYIKEAPWSVYDTNVKNSFNQYSDAAIVVLTRDSTEGTDVNAFGSDGKDGSYLSLSQEEEDLLKQLTSLKYSHVFSKVIVLLNGSQPMQVDFLNTEGIEVDAMLWIGNTGMSGVHAVCKALVGDINPSGSLPDTYCYDNFSSPAMASWVKNKNRVFAQSYNDATLPTTDNFYGIYNESVYVGYRYYETRYADFVTSRENTGNFEYDKVVAYPFGFGLSYTSFSMSDIKVQEKDNTFDVSIKVKNTGDKPGKKSVQVYVSKPYSDYEIDHHIEVPEIELMGFGKTKMLAPAEEEVVKVSFDKEELAVYDVHGFGTYILSAGDFNITVASDAHEAVNNILAMKGYSALIGKGKADLVYTYNNGSLDSVSFAKSSQTGNEIKNNLSFMDPNRYAYGGSNVVTYVSRYDWVSTYPTEQINLQLNDYMKNDLAIDREPENTGDMPTYGASNGITLSMMYGKEFKDPTWDSLLDEMTFDEQNTLLTTAFCSTASVGSVGKPQSKEMDGPTYCKESKNGVRLPCEGIWASSMNSGLLEEVGTVLANDCRSTGFNGLWIPGINIHRTPFCGRYHEYFSEDPMLTGLAAAYEIKGIQKYGVIAYPKHYIFNDMESHRNGIGIWMEEQGAREIYLRPWKYATGLKKGNAHGVMSSFNRAGTRWTSGSKELITNILREEFGFDGYIITDMADSNGANYMSCVDGIMAGTDAWLSSGKNHSFAAYKNNATVARAMRDACHRIMYSICNYCAAMDGFSASTQVKTILTWYEILLAVLQWSFIVITSGSTVLVIISKRKNNEGLIA